jgi:hypothetical protein
MENKDIEIDLNNIDAMSDVTDDTDWINTESNIENINDDYTKKRTIKIKKTKSDSNISVNKPESEKPKIVIPKNKASKKAVEECIICAESYNKSTRIPVKCEYCNFEACRTCCRTFILSESIPRCMNNQCNREWSRNFIRHNFTNAFIQTEYRDHQKELLFEKEKSLMPATQPLVENEIHIENIDTEISELYSKIYVLQSKIGELASEKSRLTRRVETSIVGQAAEFVRACPDTNCRGYLSTRWKCGLCSKWTCPTCHELKGLDPDIEHTCNPDNVASAELVSRETRNCPKCRANIFKIEGCNQMFCTQCNTPFDWKTGREIRGAIHNPHYFEWRNRMQNNPQNAHPMNLCNRHLSHTQIDNLRNNLCRKDKTASMYHGMSTRSTAHLEFMKTSAGIAFREFEYNIVEICRNLIHIHYVVLPPLNINLLQINQNIRIQYMRNKIEESVFKSKILANDKRNMKTAELHNTFQMVYDSGVDIIIRFSDYVNKIESVSFAEDPTTKEYMNEIAELAKYGNQCLDEIAFTYNSTSWSNLSPNLAINNIKK